MIYSALVSPEVLTIISRLKFRELDYLGTYVCCLSSKCDSTLIWAHHNKEIKVEYLLTDINRTIANRKSSDLVGRAFLI